jgi:hypothetical protein
MGMAIERPGPAARRTPEEDAKARAWSREMHRLAEAGLLPDNSDYIEQQLEEERAKLADQ